MSGGNVDGGNGGGGNADGGNGPVATGADWTLRGGRGAIATVRSQLVARWRGEGVEGGDCIVRRALPLLRGRNSMDFNCFRAKLHGFSWAAPPRPPKPIHVSEFDFIIFH